MNEILFEKLAKWGGKIELSSGDDCLAARKTATYTHPCGRHMTISAESATLALARLAWMLERFTTPGGEFDG